MSQAMVAPGQQVARVAACHPAESAWAPSSALGDGLQDLLLLQHEQDPLLTVLGLFSSDQDIFWASLAMAALALPRTQRSLPVQSFQTGIAWMCAPRLGTPALPWGCGTICILVLGVDLLPPLCVFSDAIGELRL